MAIIIISISINLVANKSYAEIDNYIVSLPKENVNETEKNGLIFMFEEEKLARDVYSALHAVWGDRIFVNIAASEQQHMNSIRELLIKYGIDVPNDVQGVFSVDIIQKLYTTLTTTGSKSLEDALFIGAKVEDLDIADLMNHLSETDNRDIQIVYQNLMKGSRNHLRSFGGRLEALGKPYEAQYLDDVEVQAILSSANERYMLDEKGQPVR